MALGNQAWGDDIVPQNSTADGAYNDGYPDERWRLGTRREQLAAEVVQPLPAAPTAGVTYASSMGATAAAAAANFTPEGDRTWVFVFNDEAATDFVVGDCIRRDTADFNDWDGILTTGAHGRDLILGLAQSTIDFGRFGWIGRNGTFLAQDAGAGALAAGALVASAAGGTLAASGAPDNTVGHVGPFGTDNTLGELYVVQLNLTR